MIDHDYQITVRQVSPETSQNAFIAKLSTIYIIDDGKRSQAPYPATEFTATNRVEALLKANRVAQSRLAKLTAINS